MLECAINDRCLLAVRRSLLRYQPALLSLADGRCMAMYSLCFTETVKLHIFNVSCRESGVRNWSEMFAVLSNGASFLVPRHKYSLFCSGGSCNATAHVRARRQTSACSIGGTICRLQLARRSACSRVPSLHGSRCALLGNRKGDDRVRHCGADIMGLAWKRRVGQRACERRLCLDQDARKENMKAQPRPLLTQVWKPMPRS